MLEDDYSAIIEWLISKLPCHVQIPTEWGDYFDQDGLLGTKENDGRRFPRKHLRRKAILDTRSSTSSVNRQPLLRVVYTRDISRVGISFLNAEQMYPEETGQLWLPNRRLRIKVVHCDRVSEHCYVIGAT